MKNELLILLSICVVSALARTPSYLRARCSDEYTLPPLVCRAEYLSSGRPYRGQEVTSCPVPVDSSLDGMQLCADGPDATGRVVFSPEGEMLRIYTCVYPNVTLDDGRVRYQRHPKPMDMDRMCAVLSLDGRVRRDPRQACRRGYGCTDGPYPAGRNGRLVGYGYRCCRTTDGDSQQLTHDDARQAYLDFRNGFDKKDYMETYETYRPARPNRGSQSRETPDSRERPERPTNSRETPDSRERPERPTNSREVPDGRDSRERPVRPSNSREDTGPTTRRPQVTRPPRTPRPTSRTPRPTRRPRPTTPAPIFS